MSDRLNLSESKRETGTVMYTTVVFLLYLCWGGFICGKLVCSFSEHVNKKIICQKSVAKDSNRTYLRVRVRCRSCGCRCGFSIREFIMSLAGSFTSVKYIERAWTYAKR